MKQILLFVLLATIVAVSGCVVSIGGAGTKTQREVVTKEVVVVPQGTEDSATIAEIDAAGQLSFDPSRTDALKRVASRANISSAVQVHLVNTALKRITFEPNKVEVLQALIANPAFSVAAKECILKQLNQLTFEPNKAAILEAIQKKADGK
jgi:hypothetical protein